MSTSPCRLLDDRGDQAVGVVRQLVDAEKVVFAV